MSEESSTASQSQNVDLEGQQPLDPTADEEAHASQPANEILSTWEGTSVLC